MTKAEFLSGVHFTVSGNCDASIFKREGVGNSHGMITRVRDDSYYCSIEDINDKGFRAFNFLFLKKVSEFIFFKQLIPIHEKDRLPGSSE